ncbi:MAG: hypothetical protein ABL984_00395 [Pyrinomonadaceae bacterium]
MNGGSERGCGDSREKGGIYLECGSAGGGGLPMFHLIKDPITAFDRESVGLSPVGVKLAEIDGVWHVFDWVGAKHYPNAADFLEEAVRLGLSRRISKTEDLSKLTAESRLILVHPKAFIEGFIEGYPLGVPVPCVTGNHPNIVDRLSIQEAGRLWLVGDEDTVDPNISKCGPFPEWAPYPLFEEEGTPGVRKMPAFEYNLAVRPKGVKLSPGIVMIAPIERLAVVNDPDDPENLRSAMEAANKSSVPVTLDEE